MLLALPRGERASQRQFLRGPGALPRYHGYFRAYGAKALLFVRGHDFERDFESRASGHSDRAYAAVCLVKDTLAHAVFSSDFDMRERPKPSMIPLNVVGVKIKN